MTQGVITFFPSEITVNVWFTGLKRTVHCRVTSACCLPLRPTEDTWHLTAQPLHTMLRTISREFSALNRLIPMGIRQTKVITKVIYYFKLTWLSKSPKACENSGLNGMTSPYENLNGNASSPQLGSQSPRTQIRTTLSKPTKRFQNGGHSDEILQVKKYFLNRKNLWKRSTVKYRAGAKICFRRQNPKRSFTSKRNAFSTWLKRATNLQRTEITSRHSSLAFTAAPTSCAKMAFRLRARRHENRRGQSTTRPRTACNGLLVKKLPRGCSSEPACSTLLQLRTSRMKMAVPMGTPVSR